MGGALTFDVTSARRRAAGRIIAAQGGTAGGAVAVTEIHSRRSRSGRITRAAFHLKSEIDTAKRAASGLSLFKGAVESHVTVLTGAAAKSRRTRLLATWGPRKPAAGPVLHRSTCSGPGSLALHSRDKPVPPRWSELWPVRSAFCREHN